MYHLQIQVFNMQICKDALNLHLTAAYTMQYFQVSNYQVAKIVGEEGTHMGQTRHLQLTVVPPYCSKFLPECVQTCLQIRCSEAGM